MIKIGEYGFCRFPIKGGTKLAKSKSGSKKKSGSSKKPAAASQKPLKGTAAVRARNAAAAAKPAVTATDIIAGKTKTKYMPLYYIAAFLIPALLAFIAYAFFGIYPFNARSVLTLDLNGQYVSYFEAIRYAFHGKGSLFYNWSRNLSGEFMGIIGYYLASPFTFILVLLPRKLLLESLLLIQLSKIGAAGVTFMVYAQKSKNVQPLQSVIFSTAYAMMSYIVIQLIDPMWLDGPVLLPLIVLGVEYLIDDGRKLNYIIPLALMFVAHFYIGFMVAIFVALYFFYYLLFGSNRKFKGYMDYAKTIGLMGVSTIVVLMLSAFMILPVYSALSLGKFDFSTPDYSFNKMFRIWELIPTLLPDQYYSVNVDTGTKFYGRPEIYCGVITVVLLPLFYANKNIRRNNKIGYTLLTFLLVMSMYVKPINMMWHGGQDPNWLPYRYSFLLSFVLLSMAAEVFAHLDGYKLSVMSAGVSYVIIAGLVFVFHSHNSSASQSASQADPTAFLKNMLLAFVIYGAIVDFIFVAKLYSYSIADKKDRRAFMNKVDAFNFSALALLIFDVIIQGISITAPYKSIKDFNNALGSRGILGIVASIGCIWIAVLFYVFSVRDKKARPAVRKKYSIYGAVASGVFLLSYIFAALHGDMINAIKTSNDFISPIPYNETKYKYPAMMPYSTSETYNGETWKELWLGTLAFGLVLAAIYLVCLYFYSNAKQKKTRTVISVVLALVVFFEGGYNCYDTFKKIMKEVGNTDYNDYKEVFSGSEIVDKIEEYDKNTYGGTFFRAEKTFERMGNDNLAYRLKGVTHTSSVMNTRALKFLEALGYATQSYSSSYKGATPVSDSLLGIKYVIDDPSRDNNGKLISEYNYVFSTTYDRYEGTARQKKTVHDANVYENPYALSIGYMADDDILKLGTLGNDDPFFSMNNYLSSLTGNTADYTAVPLDPKDYFTSLPSTVTYDETQVRYQVYNASGYPHDDFDAVAGATDPVVNIHLTAEKEGDIYMSLRSEMRKGVNLWFSSEKDEDGKFTNHKSLGGYFENSDDSVVNLGSFEPGTELEVRLTIRASSGNTYVGSNEYVMVRQGGYLFYNLDKEQFEADIAKLQQSPWNIDMDKSTDRYLTGTVTAQAGQILSTSIPYEPGWEIYVDGKKIDSIVTETPKEKGLSTLGNAVKWNPGTPYTLYNDGKNHSVVILGSMIGVILTPGEHTVTMKYTPPGFKTGMFTLVLGIAVLVMFAIYDSKHNKVLIERRKTREQEKLGITPETAEPAKKKVQIIKSKGEVSSEQGATAKKKAEEAREEAEKLKKKTDELISKGKKFEEKAEEAAEDTASDEAEVPDDEPGEE